VTLGQPLGKTMYSSRSSSERSNRRHLEEARGDMIVMKLIRPWECSNQRFDRRLRMIPAFVPTADSNVEMRQTVILTKARIFWAENHIEHFEYSAFTMLQSESRASLMQRRIYYGPGPPGTPEACFVHVRKGSQAKVHSVFRDFGTSGPTPQRMCLPL
jgi:hypothetical protein